MATFRALAWMWPVVLLAAGDWWLRLDEIASWSAFDAQVYVVSCVLALGWVRLTGRLAAPLRHTSPVWFWCGVATLSVWSAVLLLIHGAYYVNVGTHVDPVAFSDFLFGLPDEPSRLGEVLRPRHQLLVLLLALLFVPLWRLGLGEIPRRPRRARRLWLPLLIVIVLTPLFLANVQASRGTFLPSVNVLLSAGGAVVLELYPARSP
ncbi:MAG: hypothetical protein HY342_07615 [Candidatus Lambdaproteobacteria bacterium]|nr:hypothetical protein [Candidatus Lambdaproteobacteria bacterium]